MESVNICLVLWDALVKKRTAVQVEVLWQSSDRFCSPVKTRVYRPAGVLHTARHRKQLCGTTETLRHVQHPAVNATQMT